MEEQITIVIEAPSAKKTRRPRGKSSFDPPWSPSARAADATAALRLSHDALGERLYPTPTEARSQAAEARIRELEAELARRQG